MVDDLTVSEIQFCDLFHICIAEAEIPDIDVLLHAVFVYRFRDYHDASLDIPAKGYLCGALPVFLTDLCQHRMCYLLRKVPMLPE